MNYAIIGSGAVGAYYGARLAQTGKQVHFLFHNDYQHITQHGLQITSPKGNIHISPQQINAYNDTHHMPPCDVILVCLKTTQNHLLTQLLPPLLHPNTTILLVQNGIGWEQTLATHFPNTNIAGGLAFICSRRTAPGHIQHIDFGHMLLGIHQGNPQLLQHIADDLRQSGIPIEIAPDIQTARWKKLVWNIPFNGLSVILNAKTSELLQHPTSRTMIQDIMREVIHAANTCGANIPDTYLQEMMDYSDNMTPYYPSMYQDYIAHRPLEIEAIYEAPVRLAAEHGTTLPRIALLAQQLHHLQHHHQ